MAHTTIAAGSNGVGLPTGTINVVATATTPGIFATPSGSIFVVTGAGTQTVAYTGTTATSFTGCTGGTGTMSTGGNVYFTFNAGVSQRRASGSTLSGLSQTNQAVPRGSSGESYTNTIVLFDTTANTSIDGYSTASRNRNVLSSFSPYALETSAAVGTSYFTRTLINRNTDNGITSSRRNRQSNIALTGNLVNELASGSGISYKDPTARIIGVVAVVVHYLLACYDTNGVRHYWTGTNVTLTNAPLLAIGVIYTDTLVVLGRF